MNTSTENPSKLRRHWFRFSLRTLLIVVTVFSVPLGWVGWRLGKARRRRTTTVWVENLGGYAFLDQKISESWWTRSTDKWFGRRVRTVMLYGPSVTDLSPLADLESLEWLFLNYIEASDLSPLAGLKNLKSIVIDDPQVSDLSALAELENLKQLLLYCTQVSDLSPLADLEGLETLGLSYTRVSDLSPLAELKNLHELELCDTQVSDLSPLAELKNLRKLHLHGAPVSNEQVQELKQALPNCVILHSLLVEK
jgi:Leucine-rich repeat (LRR) protein